MTLDALCPLFLLPRDRLNRKLLTLTNMSFTTVLIHFSFSCFLNSSVDSLLTFSVCHMSILADITPSSTPGDFPCIVYLSHIIIGIILIQVIVVSAVVAAAAVYAHGLHCCCRRIINLPSFRCPSLEREHRITIQRLTFGSLIIASLSHLVWLEL